MLAANASGARGWYAKKALMGMDPAMMTEALRSGKLPAHLAAQGLTMENVRQYASTRNQYAFSRYMDEEGAGTEVGAAVSGVKGAGSVGAYLKSKLGKLGAGSKAGRALIAKELELLGTARQATEGGSLIGNIGALEWELAGDKSLTPALRGKGAGAVGIKGTIQGEVAKNQARQQEDLNKFQAESEPAIKKAIGMMSTNEKELAGLTTNLVKDATEFDAALKTMTKAIMDTLGVIAPAKVAELRKQADELSKTMGRKGGAPTTKSH